MASYHEHVQGRQKAKRDRPSPLRIVKRCRGNDGDAALRANTKLTVDDSDSDVSSITDRTKHLYIFKRRAQHQSPTGRALWASSVDLRRPQTRSWEEAVGRCRGLLRKSTPNIRNYKRYLSIGRSVSSQTDSSRRLSSTCSSEPRTSTDRYRLSSTSSYEMGPKTTHDNTLQQHCQSNEVLESDSPGTASNKPSPRHMSKNKRMYILSPRIVAIPQHVELDGSESSVWVAVEISGKLSQISSPKISAPKETQNDIVAGVYVNHKLGTFTPYRFFDFGCLYDLTVEVSAVPGTAILEVVHEQSWPTTVYAGTSVLIVVHVQLHAAARRPEMRHARSRSNELMEELELQLGHVQTQLMNIRVSYHHSAFPEITNVELPQSGLCRLQSRMETTATAAITRKSGGSVWSPGSKAPQNSLFPLMVQHWGDEKAISTQRRITDSQVARVKDIACDVASAVAPTGREAAAGMTFDFDMDSLYASPELQRYLVDGNSMGSPRTNCLLKRRCERSEDGEPHAARGTSRTSPVCDMYYFGERALRALAPTPTPEKNAIRTRPGVGPRHKDSKFWDWASWF